MDGKYDARGDGFVKVVLAIPSLSPSPPLPPHTLSHLSTSASSSTPVCLSLVPIPYSSYIHFFLSQFYYFSQSLFHTPFSLIYSCPFLLLFLIFSQSYFFPSFSCFSSPPFTHAPVHLPSFFPISYFSYFPPLIFFSCPLFLLLFLFPPVSPILSCSFPAFSTSFFVCLPISLISSISLLASLSVSICLSLLLPPPSPIPSLSFPFPFLLLLLYACHLSSSSSSLFTLPPSPSSLILK